MILAMICVIALVASHIVAYWQHVEMKRIRYQLLSTRDELRAAAIADRTFRDSPVFNILDEQMSFFVERQQECSLWLLVPLMKLRRRTPERQAAWAAEQKMLQAYPIAHDAANQMGLAIIRTLMTRHVIITVLFALLTFPIVFVAAIAGAIAKVVNGIRFKRFFIETRRRARDYVLSLVLPLDSKQEDVPAWDGAHASA
jgi:hypothetical protein